ncbi:hypothetical protein PVAND_007130 [Polypedilum vanderplanki]|uniref:C2H2-type domain-containing protein n=1 Tax=Polypedilum vanderplanki TaxID=319348 RepID=A0A9J6C6W9_POLVA|nr:hypothetical protein PVAND_007130 [Polypedilum vanderplanki]
MRFVIQILQCSLNILMFTFEADIKLFSELIMDGYLMETNDEYLDKQFRKEFLTQSKRLACGDKKVLIFTRKLENFKYIYSCNLCGVLVGSEAYLDRHLNDKTHKELMKLDVLPYRSFMAGALISNEKMQIEPNYDPINSLQHMLKTMNIDNNREFESNDFKSYFKIDHDSNESSDMEYQDSSTGDEENEYKKRKKNQKKILRSHKRFERKRIRALEKSGIYNLVIQKRRKFSGSKFILPTLEDYDFPKEPEPSFMTLCRHLVTLERFIDNITMTRIRQLFTKSIELEREEFGLSDTIIDSEILKFLHSIQSSIEKNSSPFKPHQIIDAFTRALYYLTMNYAGSYAGCQDEDMNDDGYDGDGDVSII